MAKYKKDRLCRNITTCAEGEHESKAPTATSNRECLAHSLCDFTQQFQQAAGTEYQDTKCSPLTTCTKLQYEKVAPTRTTNRVCADLKVCTAAEYQTGADPDGDRICSALTVCGATQFESVAPTMVSDRGCEEEIVCTAKQTKQGTGEGAKCVVGTYEDTSRRLAAVQKWNNCENGQFMASGTSFSLSLSLSLSVSSLSLALCLSLFILPPLLVLSSSLSLSLNSLSPLSLHPSFSFSNHLFCVFSNPCLPSFSPLLFFFRIVL